jgi:Holliday junction resolvase RusA-like endonuclease
VADNVIPISKAIKFGGRPSPTEGTGCAAESHARPTFYMVIELLDIPPVPKGRPRFTKRGIAYTPIKTKLYEGLLHHEATLQMKGAKPYGGPVAMHVDVSLPKLKTDPLRPFPVTRPDIDNFIKTAMDALNGVAFEDDGQVTIITARKSYADTPGMVIVVGSVG